MKPDKDRPSTWVKFQEGMCNGCYGGCCTMPVEITAEDLIRLQIATVDEVQSSKKKLAKRLIKERLITSYREGTDLFMLAQKPNDDCVFLDLQSRLCSVYERRPGVCRKFPDIGPRPGYCPARKISK